MKHKKKAAKSLQLLLLITIMIIFIIEDRSDDWFIIFGYLLIDWQISEIK